MTQRVIAERMPFVSDPSCNRRRLPNLSADREERCTRLHVGKHVENPGSPLRIRAIVEGEVDGEH